MTARCQANQSRRCILRSLDGPLKYSRLLDVLKGTLDCKPNVLGIFRGLNEKDLMRDLRGCLKGALREPFLI